MIQRHADEKRRTR